MAKLSLKGIISLSHQLIKDGKTNTHNVELVQDDFEDCVVLTVEEATDIKYHLSNLTIISGLVEDHFRCKPIYKLLNLLRDRIEQSEMSKQSS